MISHTDIDEIYLINKKSEIEILEAFNKYKTESSLHTMYENENGKSNAIVEFVRRLYKAILDSIASVFDMISNLFNKDDKISKDEYLKSRQGEMVFDYDIVKQQKFINSKAKEGNSLMNRLLKGESVHDKVVRFVNDTARMLESKDGRNKIYASAAPIVYGYHVDLKDTIKDFSNLDKAIGPKLDYPDQINSNDIKMVSHTMHSLSSRANNLVGMYFRQYDKLDRTDMKKMKTMKVK